MFNRKSSKLPNTVSTSAIDAIQFGAVDPRTEASNRQQEINNHLLIDQIHPWEAQDVVQAQLACYAIAYANDRMAEIMVDHAKETGGKNGDVLPRQIEPFARELSQLALDRLVYADGLSKQIKRGDVSTFEWDEDTIQDFNIANLLPKFPEYPYGYGNQDGAPYDRTAELGQVTPVFVEGLNQAGKELQATAYAEASGNRLSAFEAPEQYAALTDILKSTVIADAQEQSDQATSHLDQFEYFQHTQSGEPLKALSKAYEFAYNGYVSAGLAYTALRAPAVLGTDWIYQRS